MGLGPAGWLNDCCWRPRLTSTCVSACRSIRVASVATATTFRSVVETDRQCMDGHVCPSWRKKDRFSLNVGLSEPLPSRLQRQAVQRPGAADAGGHPHVPVPHTRRHHGDRRLGRVCFSAGGRSCLSALPVGIPVYLSVCFFGAFALVVLPVGIPVYLSVFHGRMCPSVFAVGRTCLSVCMLRLGIRLSVHPSGSLAAACVGNQSCISKNRRSTV
jgi:hypothetical protein